MEWKTYRTRFLVKAKQLNSNLSFVDPLGRHHSGRKGDYLVESSDGAFSITPRRIFEDVYVAMPMEHRGAFAGLPEAEVPEFAEVVRSVRDEYLAGVLLIDHNMALVMGVCDRIHVLDQGRTLAAGTPAEIRGDLNVAAAYLGETAVETDA